MPSERGTRWALSFNAAAGRRVQSAAVIAYASAGEFARWNPHLHAIFLEGGFDREGRFIHVPSLNLDKLSQYFRSSMVAFFLKRPLLNERLARNMLDWTHSGFSVDLTVKIPATSSKAREALAQYIARPPVSLQKMLFEEHAGSVLYRSEYNPYFHADSKLFPATEFLVEVRACKKPKRLGRCKDCALGMAYADELHVIGGVLRNQAIRDRGF